MTCPAHRGRLRAVCAVLAVSAWGTSPALARRAGAPEKRNGSTLSAGANCSACHSGSLGFTTGSVQLLNLPVAYNLMRSYDLEIRVEDTAQIPPAASAGFQLSAESPAGAKIGTWILSDFVNTRFSSSVSNPNHFVTHTGAGVNKSVIDWQTSGTGASYFVRWQAPATNQGPVTFWAAGNAENNSMTNSGDHVYLINITVPAAVCLLGDVNNDGLVDGLDIGGFTAALLDPYITSAQVFCACDFNVDGALDEIDTNAFVNALAPP